MAGRQRREFFQTPGEDCTGADQDCTNALLRKGCEGLNDRSTDFLRGYAGPIAVALTAGLEAFMFRWTTQRSPADSSLAHKESAASRLFSPTRTRVQIGGAPGVSDVFTTIGL
jgi:hypothetical protein